jgi:hypothetical protein
MTQIAVNNRSVDWIELACDRVQQWPVVPIAKNTRGSDNLFHGFLIL